MRCLAALSAVKRVRFPDSPLYLSTSSACRNHGATQSIPWAGRGRS